MKGLLVKTLMIAVAAAGLAACSSTPNPADGGTAKPAASADPADAIGRYVTGEDNNFADLQGDPMKTSSPGYAYFGSTEPIPGTANCVVYVFKQTNQHFAHCDLNATSLPKATVAYQTWLGNIKDAEPYWHTIQVQPLPNGDVSATMFADTGEAHGIYLSVSKVDGAGYRVSATFAKMDALKS